MKSEKLSFKSGNKTGNTLNLRTFALVFIISICMMLAGCDTSSSVNETKKPVESTQSITEAISNEVVTEATSEVTESTEVSETTEVPTESLSVTETEQPTTEVPTTEAPTIVETEPETLAQTIPSTQILISLDAIPEYSGSAYVAVNNNIPFFLVTDLSTTSYEYYSELDALGRCGVVFACLGKDLMPTEERGDIGQVKPTGWHTVKYDCVDGKYLYNRCHLIGWQLSGENANVNNLITGTRYMNVDGMLPFENMIADYVKETGNHVMYRVSPIFADNNLLSNGVLMEAKSVEDNGAGIEFCVFCYNVQPGVTINYSTGDSQLIETPTEPPTEAPTEALTEAPTEAPTQEITQSNVRDYVINTSSKKFHYPTCSRLPTKNRADVTCTREELVQQGYSPCGYCEP